MSAKERRRDDDDDIDDRPIGKKGGNQALVIGLAIGGAALVLLTCLCGGGIVAVIALSPRGTQPDEFVASWKGRFILDGQPRDAVYMFAKSGAFHEDQFDLQGRRVSAIDGRWFFRDGHIEIRYAGGPVFEKARATFVDNNTMDYRIIEHTDQAQIGTGTTFRRQ